MFIRKNAEAEIAAEMESKLITHAIEKRDYAIGKTAKAIEHLNVVAEIFDEIGMHKEAEVATMFLEALAAKKKKPAKAKPKKKPAKKSDPAVKGLTSKKMVENEKEKGWVFNNDDHDHCSCVDSMMADDHDLFSKDEREQDLAHIMHQLEENEDDYPDFEDEVDQHYRSRF